MQKQELYLAIGASGTTLILIEMTSGPGNYWAKILIFTYKSLLKISRFEMQKQMLYLMAAMEHYDPTHFDSVELKC